MTFFLQDPGTPQIKARKGPSEVPNFFGGLAASTKAAAIRNDANFLISRRKNQVASERIDTFIQKIGPENAWDELRKAGIAPDQAYDPERGFARLPATWKPYMQKVAQERAKQEGYDGPNLSMEAIDEEVNARLQKEYEAQQAIVDLIPKARGAVEFVGEMIGATVDVKNLPFMFISVGTGSFMRAIGRNAMINMAAEGVFLPAQFEMAERLEIPDPDVTTQLAIAAGAGGAFGFLGEAGLRAARWYQGRNAVPPGLDGFNAARAEARASVAEDALAEGRTLDETVEAVRAAEPPARRPPLLPNQPATALRPRTSVATTEGTQGFPAERPATAPESLQDAPEPETETPTARPEEARQEAAQALRTEADTVRKQDGKAKKPFVDFLMNGHRISKARREAGETEGMSLQIDPNGTLGRELAAADITRKSNPKLFKNGGRDRIDNLVASEMEDRFPGIIDATGTQRGADYLDEQGVIDLIKREAGGDSTWLQSRARAAELDRQAEQIEIEADRTPEQDFVEGRPAEGGFFVDIDQYEFLYGNNARDRIEADVDAHLAEIGFPVSPGERAELMDQIGKSGGDVDFLLERLAIRDAEMSRMPNADEIYDPIPGFDDETPAAGRAPDGAGDAGRSEGDTGAEGARTQGADAAGDPVTEATPAGQQTLIPGVAPVTQRQRLEAQQNTPMRGGMAPADDGLFDIGARSQRDMFSDPASPEARDLQEVVAGDLRTALEADGDFEVDVDLPDGTTRRMKASEALDNIDEVDAFSARLDLCGSVPQT